MTTLSEKREAADKFTATENLVAVIVGLMVVVAVLAQLGGLL